MQFFATTLALALAVQALPSHRSAVTVPIARHPAPGVSRLERLQIGAKHTMNKYKNAKHAKKLHHKKQHHGKKHHSTHLSKRQFGGSSSSAIDIDIATASSSAVDVPTATSSAVDVPTATSSAVDVPTATTPASDIPPVASSTSAQDVPSATTSAQDVPSATTSATDVPSATTSATDVPSATSSATDVPSATTSAVDVPTTTQDANPSTTATDTPPATSTGDSSTTTAAPAPAGTGSPGGSVDLGNSQNELFSCPVTIGNGQNLKVDLDTGSSDTWVRGASCTSSDKSCGVSGQASVNTGDSTLSSTGKTFQTGYGSGSVSGTIYSGPVSIGGQSGSYPFGVSTAETGFADGSTDGLLGLGFDAISSISTSVGKNSNYIDSLGYTGAQDVFAFYLSNAADNDSGEFTIGGYDSSKFTGPLVYIPLNAETYWQFAFSGATFAVGSTTGDAAGSTTNAIADTGTTLLILDTAPADAINKAIGAGAFDSTQGVYPIDCAKATSGPDVTFTFGGSTFSIPASVYVFNAGSNSCFSGISQGASGLGVSIFGDIFLRQYYSVYDKANNQVGFAKAVHPHA